MSVRSLTAHLSLSFILGLGLTGGLPTLARAQSIPATPEIKAAEGTSGLATHVEADAFSIQYPQEWQVDQLGEDTIEIVSAEPDPMMDIHTKVQLLRENPNAVVNRSIDEFIAEQVLVQRYSVVTVDQQSGFRIWMGDMPGERTGEMGNAIATFIGYGDNQTAVLLSQYSPDNPDAEALILQIHNSFVNRGVATAVGE